MKRTERIAIALTKDEKARIRVEASDLHISMSALIRMKVFAPKVTTHYPIKSSWIPENAIKYKRTLPVIPGTPQYHAHIYLKKKTDIVIELKLKLALPNKGLSPIEEEENLADEVGII